MHLFFDIGQLHMNCYILIVLMIYLLVQPRLPYSHLLMSTLIHYFQRRLYMIVKRRSANLGYSCVNNKMTLVNTYFKSDVSIPRGKKYVMIHNKETYRNCYTIHLITG